MYSYETDHCLSYTASSKKKTARSLLFVVFAAGAKTVKMFYFDYDVT